MSLTLLKNLVSEIRETIANTQQFNEQTVKELKKHIIRSLIYQDVNVSILKQLTDQITKRASTLIQQISDLVGIGNAIQQMIIEELATIFNPKQDYFNPIKGELNIVLFCGFAGSGTHTTLMKYAHLCKKKHFKVGLICASTYKRGYFDNFKFSATRQKIPYYISKHSDKDPVQTIKDGIQLFLKDKYEVILIQIAPITRLRCKYFQELTNIAMQINIDEIIFVVDSMSGQLVYDIVEKYSNCMININEYIRKKQYQIYIDAQTKNEKAKIPFHMKDKLITHGYCRETEKINNLFSIIPDGITSICQQYYSSNRMIGSIILTKMDCGTKGIGALAEIVSLNKSVSYFGIGQHINDLIKYEPYTFIHKEHIISFDEDINSSTLNISEPCNGIKAYMNIFTIAVLSYVKPNDDGDDHW
eukprot:372302_1